MEPIFLFAFTGTFAMAAALCARQLLADAKADDSASATEKAPAKALLMGNLGAVTLILALVYGGQNLSWWIPVSFLIVTFPALYYILLQRLLSPARGALVYGALALAGGLVIALGWLS